MSFDAEEFVSYQIANAEVRRYPFPHFFVRPVFPEDYYVELLSRLPPTEWLKPIDETASVRAVGGDGNATGRLGAIYPGRYIADLAEIEEREQRDGNADFWTQLSTWLTGNRFRHLIVDKFRADIPQRFGEGAILSTDIDTRLVRDFTRYAIGPHTDSPRKLVSLLFYLPRDESLSHRGTMIYAADDPAFRCEGNRHHGFEGFKRVAAMPFVPNSLFAFFKTDYSFHGVDTIQESDVERNLLLYNIYVQAFSTRPRRFLGWQGRRNWIRFKGA